MFLFTTPTQPSEGGTVRSALRFASERTGVNFEYLLSTAQRESGLDSTAQAKTSSARGLFQFIESTWLSTLRDAGAALGYAEYADKISSDRNGRAYVADAAAREEILRLRDDPEAAALMAGALARENAETLQARLGRTPEQGELYLAHFLGAQGAADLITLAANNPDASAAAAFPKAAQANRPIFFDRDGAARSAADVYARLTSLPEAVAPAAEQVASREHGLFTARGDSAKPFHSMFSGTSRGMGPIAAAVSALWQRQEDRAPQPAALPQEPMRTAREVTTEDPRSGSELLTADGRPLDIAPGAVDGALKSYARAAETAPSAGLR